MKTSLTLISLCLLLSCNNKQQKESNIVDEPTLDGVWKLTSFYNYLDDKIIDTIKFSEGYKQIKMYHKSKVVWTRYNEADSIDWFGYGDYSIKDGYLIELIEFGSKSMNEAIKEQKEFTFKLLLEDDTYSQIQNDEEGNPIYSENYVRIE
jgi:hypothetical protein